MNGVLLVAFILSAVVTYAGVRGSIGATAASQLESFPTLITPAAWSFSVLVAISVGEAAFALVQLCTVRFNFADKVEVRTIAPWFLSVCACQALWTVAIAQPLSSEGQSTWYAWLSLGLMLALWASLYALMWLQAGIFSDAPRPSWGRWALFHFPFQLHAAWATAALVVNVNIVLVADAARAARISISRAEPGSLNGLKKLKKYVLTNCAEKQAKESLAALGLLDAFDGVFGADAMGDTCKPCVEAFRRVQKIAGFDYARTAFFEDSVKNLAAAKTLGATTVLVASATAREEGTRSDGFEPDHVVAAVTPAEMARVLPGVFLG